MKKFILILIVVFLITVVISAVFFTQSGSSLLSKLPYTNELYTKSSLVVNSPKSSVKVTIDDEDYGTAPIELTELSPGSHTITIERVTDSEENFYQPETFYIDLQPNTEAIIDVEIGPNNNLSGYILFYTPSPTPEGMGLFTLSGTPNDALVELNGDLYEEMPIASAEVEEGEHTLSIIKEGYESVEFPIVVRDGFNLNITTYLMPIPINIEKG